MTYPSLINLTPESLLADLLSPFSLTQLLHSMQSLISPLLSPKRSRLLLLPLTSGIYIFQVCSNHSASPSVSYLPLFHLLPLQTCCTSDTPAGRRIFHSHPWPREVLLLLTPERIPATTQQAPSSPLSLTCTQLPWCCSATVLQMGAIWTELCAPHAKFQYHGV